MQRLTTLRSLSRSHRGITARIGTIESIHELRFYFIAPDLCCVRTEGMAEKVSGCLSAVHRVQQHLCRQAPTIGAREIARVSEIGLVGRRAELVQVRFMITPIRCFRS